MVFGCSVGAELGEKSGFQNILQDALDVLLKTHGCQAQIAGACFRLSLLKQRVPDHRKPMPWDY